MHTEFIGNVNTLTSLQPRECEGQSRRQLLLPVNTHRVIVDIVSSLLYFSKSEQGEDIFECSFNSKDSFFT